MGKNTLISGVWVLALYVQALFVGMQRTTALERRFFNWLIARAPNTINSMLFMSMQHDWMYN